MADLSEEGRAASAKAGHALADGSYPIENCEDLTHAREAYGRAPASHRGELRALINRRNEELGCGQEPFEPGD
jgi:hypothetical protein